jgi:hypothetical protein
MTRQLTVLAALATITSAASGQDGTYDYTFRVEARASYAMPYRTEISDFRFAGGYGLGGEAAVRLKSRLGLGVAVAYTTRDTLESVIYGAALNIRTTPAVTLKLGLAGIRAPYRIIMNEQSPEEHEIRTVTMPALHLGGQFMRSWPGGDRRFIVSLAMDNYLMFFTNRELNPPSNVFRTYRVDHSIIMVPTISIGGGVLLGGRKAP